MESRRRNPLCRYPTAVCISVLHFGLTQPKTRALNSPGFTSYWIAISLHVIATVLVLMASAFDSSHAYKQFCFVCL
jgi:hypothetical protein